MTLLGKVFTGLIFAFSLIFFASALIVNATHVSWYDAVMNEKTGYRVKNAQLQRTITETNQLLERTKLDLAREQAARRIALSSLQTTLSQTQAALGEKEVLARQLQESNTIQNATLSSTQSELKRVTDENATKTQRISEIVTQRNESLQKVIALTDVKNNLESMVDDVRSTNSKLLDQQTITQARLDNTQERLRALGTVEDPGDVPPRGLTGYVQAIGTNGLVEISLGGDDGVREGHELDITRGATLIGRITLQKVQDDKAIGKLNPALRKAAIQLNDKVVPKAGVN